MGDLQNGWFVMENLLRWMIQGYPDDESESSKSVDPKCSGPHPLAQDYTFRIHSRFNVDDIPGGHDPWPNARTRADVAVQPEIKANILGSFNYCLGEFWPN